MEFINTDKICSLQELICSGDINDKTGIAIYSAEGKFLCRGKWYEDKVLEYSEQFGKAHKAGTGISIAFRLIYPRTTN